MTTRNLYDVLGVSPNASPDQIRQAYLGRSKVLHPDRFDQSQQANEWKLANEMLVDVNHAYSVLRNSSSRSAYDQQACPQPKSSSQPPPPRSAHTHRTTPKPPPDLGRLTSGFCLFSSLTPTIQEKLLKRASGENKHQVKFPIEGIGQTYFWSLLLCIWHWGLYYMATENRWSPETSRWLLGLTAAVALLQAYGISQIVLWHKSAIKSWLIVTPLYVIKTHLERVWYWPIWEITDISGTHQYRNSIYLGTAVRLAFGSHQESFTLSSTANYSAFVDALRAFDGRVRMAKSQGEWGYFLEQDDFRKHEPAGSPTQSPSCLRLMATAFCCCCGLFGISFAIAKGINKSKFTSPSRETSSALHQNAPAEPAYGQSLYSRAFSFEEVASLPLPESGEIVAYTGLPNVAPFEIKSSAGSHYFVKLSDAATGRPVIAVFVRGGQTVSVDVPLGNYVVKYASGDQWLGYDSLFGPATSYSKASKTFSFRSTSDGYTGFTVTLYKVRNGNLNTRKIVASEF